MRDWVEVNRQIPRLVDALPNGPHNFATVQVFLAGGVPEVMLELRAHGLLDARVKTVSGETLDTCLNWWRESSRRAALAPRVARERWDRSRGCDHVARSRAVAGAHVDCLLSHGQSGAGGIGHQEHVDRSIDRGRRQRVSARRAGACLCDGDGGDSEPSSRVRLKKAT